MGALKRANDIRTARQRLKRALKTGRASIVDVLSDPPDYVQTAKVFDLLLAVPDMGRIRTNRLLTSVGIEPAKTLGGLSARQRATLISALPARARRRGSKAQGSLAKKRAGSPRKGKARRSKAKAKPAPKDPGKFVVAEWERLTGDEDPEQRALERAVRIAAAEQSWRAGLGVLLSADDVQRLLDVDHDQLERLQRDGVLIALSTTEDKARFPAYQFQEGKPTPLLAQAHRVLVEDGHLSAWSAASWGQTAHHELDDLSPARWIGEHRGKEALLRIAKRDASRLAQ
jgi:hypothetical protein